MWTQEEWADKQKAISIRTELNLNISTEYNIDVAKEWIALRPAIIRHSHNDDKLQGLWAVIMLQDIDYLIAHPEREGGVNSFGDPTVRPVEDKFLLSNYKD